MYYYPNRHPRVRQELESWQIDFNSSPVEITARVLPCDTLLFGDVIKIIFYYFFVN